MSLAKRQIAHQFSRAAATYDEVAQLQFEMANQLIEQIPLGQTGTLVDFGCGTGYALEQISEFTDLRLQGIDIAPGMIKYARERLPGAILELGDLEQTKLADHTIDVVFSNAAIQWCDTKVAFEEMARVLKPGGLLLVSTFGPGTLNQWKAAWQAIGDQHTRIHEFATREALVIALESSGFSQVDVSREIRFLKFNSVRSMFQSIKKLGATNAAPDRPAGLLGREQFLKLCAYFEKQLLHHGHIQIGFECIYIAARAAES